MQVAQHIPHIPKALLAPQEIGALGALFEPTQSLEADITSKQVRLINDLVSVVDRQLLNVVGSRSEAEFYKAREVAFPKYIRALRALHDTVKNLIDDFQIEAMRAETLPTITADLQKQEVRFGPTMTEQALFTLWTTEKMRSLAHKIDALLIPEGKRKADKKLFHEYYTNCLWSQFHLDALLAAVKLDRPIAEEIREPILNGLRAAVDAYTIMQEALSLRQPRTAETIPSDLPWDEEDERLLAASMRDMKHVDYEDR